MTQLSSKSINDNDTSPSADDEVIESFNLAISPWRSSMQVNTKKTYPIGPTGRVQGTQLHSIRDAGGPMTFLLGSWMSTCMRRSVSVNRYPRFTCH